MRTIIKAIFSFTAISFLSLSAFYETSAAREIEISEAVGLVRLYSGEEKQAKDGALREAMKSAVEQGVGAVLNSETEIENFQVVSDNILKKSKGAIKSYRILREGAVDNGVNYEVVISAVVDDDLLNSSLESFRLMQQLTGRKTVFVVYNPQVQGDLPLNPENGNDFQIIATGLTGLQEAFIDRRFEVLYPEKLQENFEDQEKMALAQEADFEDVVSELSAKYGAQYYVVFTLMASATEREKIGEAQAIIHAKLYNTGTAKIIKTIEGRGKKKYKKTTSGMDLIINMKTAVGKATKQVRKKLVNSLIERLYEYAEDGAPMLVRIHVAKKSHVRAFMKMIKGLKIVTGTKTISSIGKDATLHVYGIGDTDSFLDDVDDNFYKNRRFKGYALSIAQSGEVLDLNMEEDE